MRNHNTEKTYYECLAKLILENVFPNKYHDIKLQDRPDLVACCRLNCLDFIDFLECLWIALNSILYRYLCGADICNEILP